MQNLLDMRPVRLREYRHNDKKGDGNYTILVPKFGNGAIGTWLKKLLKNPDYLIHLDDFGSFIWQHCDGSKPVRQIGTLLQDRFGERVDPVFDRLSLFFKQMEKSKLIAFRENVKGDITSTELNIDK